MINTRFSPPRIKLARDVADGAALAVSSASRGPRLAARRPRDFSSNPTRLPPRPPRLPALHFSPPPFRTCQQLVRRSRESEMVQTAAALGRLARQRWWRIRTASTPRRSPQELVAVVEAARSDDTLCIRRDWCVAMSASNSLPAMN